MAEYAAIDWEMELEDFNDPSAMTERLHQITTDLNDRYFPLKKRKIRSTDDPWISDEIRREIRRRMRLFGTNRRGPKWIEAKKRTDKLIKDSKSQYYAQVVTRLTAEGSNQIPYNILKDIAIPDRPAPWSVNHVAPGLGDSALAESLADYFVKIIDKFSPLTGAPPTTFRDPYPMMKPHEIAERIRAGKNLKLLSPVTSFQSSSMRVPTSP